MAREQKRGKRIAMSPDELDVFLAEERMCRLGSLGADGAPHVSPLWFVWDRSTIWLNSVVKSQRWANLVRDPRVSVAIDGGEGYFELRGAELIGRIEVVGEVPRLPGGVDHSVAEAERLFGAKYTGGDFVPDGHHAWLRMVPDKIVSWDFRKMGAG